MNRSIWKPVASIVIGGMIGSVLTYSVLARYMNQGAESREAATISTSVTALNYLRESNLSNAIATLEVRLNGALVAFYASPPSSTQGSNALHAAKKYRKKYPFKGGDPDLQIAIDQILSE